MFAARKSKEKVTLYSTSSDMPDIALDKDLFEINKFLGKPEIRTVKRKT